METFKLIQIIRESGSLRCLIAAFLISLWISEPHVNTQGLEQKRPASALALTAPHCTKLQDKRHPGGKGPTRLCRGLPRKEGNRSERLGFVFVFQFLYSELKRSRLYGQLPG